MTLSESDKHSSPTTDLVRELADLLDEKGLTEIELGRDDWHIRVAKTPAPIIGSAVGGGLQAAAPLAGAAAVEPDAILDHPGLLTSPMVGVVYTAPEPGTPPFIKEGDQVSAGDTLLLIEAMKVFNPIKAAKSGKVTRILISNGVPVEYGEPLLIIE